MRDFPKIPVSHILLNLKYPKMIRSRLSLKDKIEHIEETSFPAREESILDEIAITIIAKAMEKTYSIIYCLSREFSN